jgi:hypothetical protein
MINHGKRAGVAFGMGFSTLPAMAISEKNTRLQATVSKVARKAIQKSAKAEDRSESYIVSRIVRLWLEEKNLIPRS